MSPRTPVVVSGEFTIYRAAEIRSQLVDALCTCDEGLDIDLAAVTEIDSAGVQLLMAASVAARAAGRTLEIGEVSEPVRDVLALFEMEKSSFDVSMSVLAEVSMPALQGASA